MSEGMDDKIRQISDMLSSREAQDGIRRLIGSFNGPSRPRPCNRINRLLRERFLIAMKTTPYGHKMSTGLTRYSTY